MTDSLHTDEAEVNLVLFKEVFVFVVFVICQRFRHITSRDFDPSLLLSLQFGLNNSSMFSTL